MTLRLLVIGQIKIQVIRNDCRGFKLVIHNTLEIAVWFVFFISLNKTQVFVTYLTGALYVHPL